MPVTFDEVRRIASLAGLRSVPGEEDEVAPRMAEIVELAGGMSTFVAEGEVDGGEPPGASALDMEVMAEAVAGDVPGECLDRELVLANAPDHEDGFVRLPPIRRGRTEGGAREETE